MLDGATELTMTRHSAQGKKCLSEPLVLLHGWGCDERSWAPILDQLCTVSDVWSVQLPGFGSNDTTLHGEAYVDAFVSTLAAQLPPRVALLGWSLGGMLALQFAARYPERCAYVMTLAANMSFVQREGWPAAMTNVAFKQFYRGFCSAPELTLKRFSMTVGAGGNNARALSKSFMGQSTASFEALNNPVDQWSNGLKALAFMDNREVFQRIKVPGLHVFADGDDLVPVSAATELQKLNSHQSVVIVNDACHALHWSQPQQVLEHITTFLADGQCQVDKRKVADSFGRAAENYDSVAQLQRDIGHELLERAAVTADSKQVWLDLGCGTGYFSPQLQRHFGEVIGLDISQGMLNFASSQHRDLNHWLCADAEQLPLGDNTLDGIYSSLAIQWCHRLPQLFCEIKRVLKPGGTALIATLGPKTLHEIKCAWEQVDDYTHVNRFASQEEVSTAITNAGFESVSWRTDYKVLPYDELRQLTYELKTLGAHNMNHGQSNGLTGRQRIKKFRQAYEAFRDENGQLPATYEVFYLELIA